MFASYFTLYLAPIFLCLVAVSFQTCVTTPGSERKQLILMPRSQMNAMGESAYKQMLAKEKLSSNKALTQKVVEIGRDIAKASGADFDWEFKLIESKQINAFCLPGGKIGVYTGILEMTENNAGLAAVLGHEVAHATARHSNERVSQQLLISGSLVALNVAMKDQKKRNLLMAAIGLGAQFGVILPYGRRQESEADQIGLKFMARAGYDPAEAPKLWERMSRKGSGGPEWLSTHPDPMRRARDLRSQISDVKNVYEKSNQKKTVKL